MNTSSSTRHLKLRGDLVVSQQETPAGTIFVVKDPQIGRFFRFKATEYFIAQQLDGATPLMVVRQRVEEKFDAALTQETLERFTAKLDSLGLLETEDAERASHHRPPGRVRGDPLQLRVKAFDPDRFFDRIVHKVSFFFTPQFLIFSAALIVFALGVTVANRWEIAHSFHGLLTWQTLVLAWLITLVVVFAHESAHGLTCKYHGGRVHEIGFLVLYLQPAFYCNVSDAWLFPEKSKRLWVTFAGAYFEMFLWAVATLVWRVTDPATLVNYLALVIAATSAIKSLFNFNPLIKLDGYYLLSDYLEIPNLRRRAFSHIGSCARRLWGRGSVQPVQAPTRRERRIYWTYGLLAGAYSFWLLSFIILNFGRFMTRRYQGWGFVIFSALVVFVFRHPLRRFLRLLASLFKREHGMMAVVKRLAKVVVVLGVVSATLFFVRTELKVSGEFKILPIHNADVRAEVEGIIEEIPKDEGDRVNAGDLIARLADRDYRAELRKTQAEIEEKEARLKMLKSGARAEEIDLAKTTVTKAEQKLKYAQSYLTMEKNLFEGKLSSRKDFELAEELVSVRQKELDEANGNLKVILAGSRPEEVEAIQAEVTRLVAQQSYLAGQLQRINVVSPISGVIITHKLKEKVGQNVKKGDLIAEVHEMNKVTAEISVPEKEISDVKLGQRVMLKARAYSQASFDGKVISIAPVVTKPTEVFNERMILVVTQLDNADLLLKPEMSGNAKIYCGTHRLYEIVLRRFIRFLRVEFWSWW